MSSPGLPSSLEVRPVRIPSLGPPSVRPALDNEQSRRNAQRTRSDQYTGRISRSRPLSDSQPVASEVAAPVRPCWPLPVRAVEPSSTRQSKISYQLQFPPGPQRKLWSYGVLAYLRRLCRLEYRHGCWCLCFWLDRSSNFRFLTPSGKMLFDNLG